MIRSPDPSDRIRHYAEDAILGLDHAVISILKAGCLVGIAYYAIEYGPDHLIDSMKALLGRFA